MDNVHGPGVRKTNDRTGEMLDAPASARETLRDIHCPYHSVLLQTPLRPHLLPGVHPRQRLEYTPLCDLPVGISRDCNVGTSASAGCTCAQDQDIAADEMVRELDGIIKEAKGGREKRNQ